jgi:hypothetical protein
MALPQPCCASPRLNAFEKNVKKNFQKKIVQAQLGLTGLNTNPPFWVRYFLSKAVKTLIYTYPIHM